MEDIDTRSILDRFPALRELSPEEKVHLICELDQDLLWAELQMPPEVEKALLEVLERRRQEYLADPSLGIPYEEFRKRMDAFKAQRKAERHQQKSVSSE